MDFDKGIIIVDKPPGPTSHEVSAWVKKILKCKRTGHAGTLDPMVTGVLPIALGKSTRLLGFITKARKTYVGVLKFNKNIDEDKIKQLFKLFEGPIIQFPPKKCAIKRVHRTRTIESLKVLEVQGQRVLFRADVQAGTYIRSITRDVSYMFNFCILEELRRISVGDINEDQAVTLQELVDAYWAYENKQDSSLLNKIIKPIENYIKLPKLYIDDNAVNSILNGAPLFRPGIVEYDDFDKGNLVAIYSSHDFLGVHIADMDSINIKNVDHGIISKPKTILPS